jgi:hypothetical protein
VISQQNFPLNLNKLYVSSRIYEPTNITRDYYNFGWLYCLCLQRRRATFLSSTKTIAHVHCRHSVAITMNKNFGVILIYESRSKCKHEDAIFEAVTPGYDAVMISSYICKLGVSVSDLPTTSIFRICQVKCEVIFIFLRNS